MNTMDIDGTTYIDDILDGAYIIRTKYVRACRVLIHFVGIVGIGKELDSVWMSKCSCLPASSSLRIIIVKLFSD
jgi:hypothetical protein